MTESGVMGQSGANSSPSRDSVLSLSRLTPADSNAPQRGAPGTADYPYRAWEDVYRNKWRWDKVVKGTCNRADCIAACSLDLYVKDGMVWREEQATVYEAANPSFPDFNPRGCQKGMCYSDLMYEPSRVKYPLKRVGERGSGKWQRISWDEATSEIADAILDACVEDGPESVVYDCGTTNVDFGPGTPAELRLVQLIGTTYLDEWASVGDLPMGAIQTWGLFNAEGTSDDWFNSDYILVWLGNPVYTRVPDVHFMWEARYRGAKVVSIAPDYNATTLHADLWINPRIGTDTALALGMAQVIVAEGLYDEGHIKEQTDLPLLIRDDTNLFLRQQDIQAEGQDDIFYFWDSKSGGPAETPGSYGHPGESIALDGIDPALEGSFQVTLRDGRTVTVRPVFERLKERLAAYSPERASEITGVHPNIIRKVAREMAGARAAMIFASWGACKHYHMDLTQRVMILLLALTGHVGKPGGGLRIGAWWQMTLNYDPNPPALPPGRPLVRDVEKMMKSMTEIWMTTSPTMVWLYAHDEGFARVVNESSYQDPAYPREIAEYAREAIEKRWMPVHPRPGTKPRVFLYTGMNPLRRWPMPHIIRDNLWANMKLIVCWDFRMSTSAMYSDIVLPAAGWHEKAGVKFAQSYVPYICVGDEAVPPLYESKNEFDIMAILAAKIQERAREREMGSYLDALGGEHDPTRMYDDHSLNGEYGEGEAAKALDTVLRRSLPIEDTTVEEATRKGAIRIKSSGQYGPLTAICSDLEPDQPLHPFDWFVRDKQPWPTLTGRQQFYIDHPWYLEVGEELPVHKEEPKAGGDHPLRMSGGHTRWSIHAIWRTNRLMLRLQRGQPVAYINPKDAQARGIADHDRVWIYNDIGGFKVHAKVAPGVQPGQVMIYHAWEPYQFERWMGSQTVVPSAFKPLHLVGDYGHLQYRFAFGQPSHVCRNMTVEMEKT